MADKLTKEQRHKCMSSIRSKDTKPEIRVRKRLFAEGFRFRLAVKSLPGTPDIVLPRYRSIILVNGCFWHGHKGCRYYVLPKTNLQFWKDKIERNQQRDDIVCGRLEALGWRVFTVWECQLSSRDIDATMEELIRMIRQAGEDYQTSLRQRREERKRQAETNREKKARKDMMQKELDSIYHIPGSVKKLSEADNN